MSNNNTKWVACWGNATSITNRSEAIYAKNLTLRYPVRMPFSGSQLRFRFSNLTGTEPATLNKVFVDHTPITFSGNTSVTLMPGKETESDAISHAVNRGDTIEVSMYMADYTQMNSGTLITGPLSKGFYAYGDYAEADVFDTPHQLVLLPEHHRRADISRQSCHCVLWRFYYRPVVARLYGANGLRF